MSAGPIPEPRQGEMRMSLYRVQLQHVYRDHNGYDSWNTFYYRHDPEAGQENIPSIADAWTLYAQDWLHGMWPRYALRRIQVDINNGGNEWSRVDERSVDIWNLNANANTQCLPFHNAVVFRQGSIPEDGNLWRRYFYGPMPSAWAGTLWPRMLNPTAFIIDVWKIQRLPMNGAPLYSPLFPYKAVVISFKRGLVKDVAFGGHSQWVGVRRSRRAKFLTP
jgi:hypothetical protein